MLCSERSHLLCAKRIDFVCVCGRDARRRSAAYDEDVSNVLNLEFLSSKTKTSNTSHKNERRRGEAIQYGGKGRKGGGGGGGGERGEK